MWRLGVDLGGTKIEALLLDSGGQEVWRERVATPREDYRAILQAIVHLCEGARARASESPTIGLGMPGALSHRTGRVKNSNTRALNDRPLREDLQVLLGQPMRVENDANCFAVSEAIDGAAVGAEVVFGVILGTGVGGGLVVNQKLLVGYHHIAGEWGHNPMPLSGLAPITAPEQQLDCYCGRINCIETFLSGPGWLTRERMRSRAAGRSELPVWLQGTQAIVAAAARGETAAMEAVVRYGEQLAAALAGVVNLLDPQVIVLGGGMGQIDAFYPVVQAALTKHVFSDECRTRVLKPKHGDSSGVRGAAWLWEASGA